MSQLALVIDLNVCVGCHACVTSCKEWNTSGTAGPMADMNPFSKDPTGTFFNRVQTFEVGTYPNTETVHFPKSCLHCEDPPCVPGVPDRRQLQARIGWHCAGGQRKVHWLQLLLLGLPRTAHANSMRSRR